MSFKIETTCKEVDDSKIAEGKMLRVDHLALGNALREHEDVETFCEIVGFDEESGFIYLIFAGDGPLPPNEDKILKQFLETPPMREIELMRDDG